MLKKDKVKEELLLTEEEVKKIKNKKGRWKFLYEILDMIGDSTGFSLYSKNNTIAITNFFRINEEECFVDNNKIKTLQNYKKKIWKKENERELYIRIIFDYIDIINLYLGLKKENDKLILPKRKSKYRLRRLEERKKEPYPIIKIKKDRLRTIDKKIFEKIRFLKEITQEDIEKWTEYIMIWNTYDGTRAEIKVKDILEREVPEIKWEWSSEEEDIRGIDIKGYIEGSDEALSVQIKGAKSAGRGAGEVDIKNTIIVYYGSEDGEVFLIPKRYGKEGWVAYFLRIYCKIKNIDFVEFINKRKKKISL